MQILLQVPRSRSRDLDIKILVMVSSFSKKVLTTTLVKLHIYTCILSTSHVLCVIVGGKLSIKINLLIMWPSLGVPLGGTAAAAPPPFRPSDPALCGSCPLVTPY